MRNLVVLVMVVTCPLFGASRSPVAGEIADVIMETSIGKAASKRGLCPALDEGSIVGPIAHFRLVERCRQGSVSIISQFISLDIRDGSMFFGLDQMTRAVSLTVREQARIRGELGRLKLSLDLASQIVGLANESARPGTRYTGEPSFSSSSTYQTVISRRADAEAVEYLYLHLWTGELLKADLFTVVYRPPVDLLNRWLDSARGAQIGSVAAQAIADDFAKHQYARVCEAKPVSYLDFGVYVYFEVHPEGKLCGYGAFLVSARTCRVVEIRNLKASAIQSPVGKEICDSAKVSRSHQ